MSCYTDYTVYPPAQGDWWDVETVVADVLARLRLQPSDVDYDRLRGLVPVAAMQINSELDRVYAMTPVGTVDTGDVDEDADITELLQTNVTPTILESLSRLVIELYRRGRTDINSDIPFEAGAAIDVVRGDLAPHVSRFGIA